MSRRSLALAGAVIGLTWAAALRAFMSAVAGPATGATWTGTFLWVLLPGAVIGAVLASARSRWAVWSPMLFGAVLLQDPLGLIRGTEGALGLGAIAVPALCMIGAYALAGRGPRWVRAGCGLVALSAIPAWALTAADVGGPSLSIGDPHGAWAAVLYWGLLATGALAAAIPHRRQSDLSSGGPPTRTTPVR